MTFWKKWEFMNRISPKKLLNTKWTATNPVKKEKHFLIIELIKEGEEADPQLPPQFVKLEAVYSNSVYQIDWNELKDSTKWRQGWV